MSGYDIYITIFLHSKAVGRSKIGSQARIKVDSLYEIWLLANITDMANADQFTPKYIVTIRERERLVYRVKLQIPKLYTRKYRGLLGENMTTDHYAKMDDIRQWASNVEF
jgi:HlyD family secretion protein